MINEGIEGLRGKEHAFHGTRRYKKIYCFSGNYNMKRTVYLVYCVHSYYSEKV
jgi:hypothetical protein